MMGDDFRFRIAYTQTFGHGLIQSSYVVHIYSHTIQVGQMCNVTILLSIMRIDSSREYRAMYGFIEDIHVIMVNKAAKKGHHLTAVTLVNR